MNQVLGGRGAAGYVLGHGASGAAQWWTAGGATNCVAAYQPKGAASLAASYVNLANPGTYNAAPGVAPTWDAATGWIFADWQYLRTGIAVSGSYTWILRYGNFTIQQNRIPFGARISGLNGTWCEMGPTSGTTGYFVNGSATGFTTWGVSGVIGVSGSTAYRNGSAVGSTMTSANNTNTMYEAYIGALNNGGTPLSGYYFLGNISSVWIAATTLNAAQMATQSAAMP